MQLVNDLHNLVLDCRNLEGFVTSERFQYALASSTEEEKKTIYSDFVKSCSLDKQTREQAFERLRKFITWKNESDMNLRQMRDKARDLGVRYYSRLGKSQLLAEIHVKELLKGKNGSKSVVTNLDTNQRYPITSGAQSESNCNQD